MPANTSFTRRLGSGLGQLIPTRPSDRDPTVAVDKLLVSRTVLDVAAVLLADLGKGVDDPTLRDLAEVTAAALRATLEPDTSKSPDV